MAISSWLAQLAQLEHCTGYHRVAGLTLVKPEVFFLLLLQIC